VEDVMEVIHAQCAGLDVHPASVVACARRAQGQRVERTLERFGTTTRELLRLSDWLEQQGCTHVAMESSGVYWKPVWHVLEGRFELLLANAMHIRNIPGRKSDVNDATWIADLLAHGLIRGSLVPPTEIRELRDLTRTRKQLSRERTQHVQRIQKVLEDCNVKLTGVVSDILGHSGRAILTAIIAGETDPDRLFEITTGKLKAPRATLVEALRGRVTDHHRFMLQLHLDQIAGLERAITALEQQADELLRPFRDTVERLMTMPGISRTAAHVMIAEIGLDMARFPSPAHLRSWVGLCPRLDISAGKRLSNRTRRGCPWLKTLLVQSAWAAVRREGYFRAPFLRLKSRRGPKKAILAVAASILSAAYYMLRDHVEFRDLGADYFHRRDRARLARTLLKRLRDLGVDVHINTAAA
jgi:transposase